MRHFRTQEKESFRVTMRYQIALLLCLTTQLFAQKIGNYSAHTVSNRSVLIEADTGETIRVTPYGDNIVRVQAVREKEDFYSDDRYEMVVRHDWDGKLDIGSNASTLNLSTNNVTVSVTKEPLRLAFSLKGQDKPLLQQKDGITWGKNTVNESFIPTTDQHFAGLGHEKYGRIKKLDRTGTSLKVTSGSEGACVVPFYLSSKGYGVFLNTTFTHTISLCKENVYSLEIDGEGYGGQMDYFFIAGPALPQVIDNYTQLTGRPRMPEKSIFGLHLSDKTDPQNKGESWWKKMVTDHRNAGYAIDHQVNDNVWRASKGATSAQNNSWFAWRLDRYPDPASYDKWCEENGITVTLDLNRPGIWMIPSWKEEYGIPGSKSCPDFTNKETREWIWDLFYSVGFDPSKGRPGDAIWLDEFDWPDHRHSTKLHSGKMWAEESINYHFNLMKACVQEGWDPTIGEAKRPYFWVRGITAGAQRFGTHWTGDLNGNYTDMENQVRALQSSGLSGFPYFNHDAGGHFRLTVNGDNIYHQWDMGFGALTPIWKPHGPSHKRWPLQRNEACQATAKKYITMRYEMIPYIYTYAYHAQATGIPMARPMFLEDQNNPTAWKKELQYYWGKELLVAPNCTEGNNDVSVWLPEGNWYDFWNDKKYTGNQTINYYAARGVMPVFAAEGSIIPMAPYAKSTFFIPNDKLVIHIYTGKDGAFQLYEDDGVTEKFRTKKEFRTTDIQFRQDELALQIQAAKGSYSGAVSNRSYQIIYHGLSGETKLYCGNKAIPSYAEKSKIPVNQNGMAWDSEKKLLNVYLSPVSSDKNILIANIAK